MQPEKNSVAHSPETARARLDLIASGDFLPDSMEELESCLTELFALARMIVPVSAIILAQARRRHFSGSTTDWAKWASALTGYEGAVLHHRRAIGDMLLAQRGKDSRIFTRLAALTEDRLIVLTRLSHSELGAFMSVNTVETFSRDKLREAVAAWLGEEPRDAKEPELPGFSRLLDIIQDIEPNKVIKQVDSLPTANKFMHGGIVMMAAAVEYHKREKNIEVLEALKDALLDEAKKIEQAITAKED